MNNYKNINSILSPYYEKSYIYSIKFLNPSINYKCFIFNAYYNIY
jgi:hypothetical protein